MSEHIETSPRGEAIVPRDVCERPGWRPGQGLIIEAADGGLIIRANRQPPEVNQQQ